MKEKKILTFQQHNAGLCQQCGKQQESLLLATISAGEKSQSMLLCRDCARTLKTRFDENNENQPPVQQPRVMSTAPEQAGDIEKPVEEKRTTKGSTKKKSGKRPFLIAVAIALLVVSVIAGVILFHVMMESSENNEGNANSYNEDIYGVNNGDNKKLNDDDSNAAYSSGFHKTDGPLLVKKETELGTSYKLYQYVVRTGEIKHVFTFNTSCLAIFTFDTVAQYSEYNRHRLTFGYNVNEYDSRPYTCFSNFQYAQQFSSDLSKAAIVWVTESDGTHVGYVDANGNVTDVTNLTREKTTGFTSTLPRDNYPLFTSEDIFVFLDDQEGCFKYFDTNKQEVIKQLSKDDYSYKSWGTLTYEEKGLADDGLPIVGSAIEMIGNYKNTFGSDYILYNGHYINLEVHDNHIYAWGPDMGSPRKNGYDEYGDYYYGVGKAVTPDTEYSLIGDIACCGNDIYFSATRGSERSLFYMKFDNGSFSEPELLGSIEGYELAFCKK